MALKDSGTVTITLNRTTVKKLRSEKGGIAWDTFMLNLIEGMKQGVRAKCVLCGKVVESTDIDLSPSELARRLKWKEILIRGKPKSIGFVCDKCSREEKKKNK